MAIIFAEQSETGSVAWLSTVGGIELSGSPVAGSWSTYSLRHNGGVTGVALMSASVSEVYGQMRVYFEDAIESNGNMFRLRSQNNVDNLSFGPSGASRLVVYRGNQATLLATGTTVFHSARWYYLQFHFTIHDTTGTVQFKIDGVSETFTFVVGTETTQDTRDDAGANGNLCDRFSLEATTNTDTNWDDIVINDITDTDNVSYPDNLGIEALMPSAAGDQEGLTPYVPTAQRFYFTTPSEAPATVSPSPGALWDVNGLLMGNRRGMLAPAKRGTTMTTLGIDDYGFSQGDDVLIAQWVSPPLAAQTIDGTVKMYMRSREAVVGDDLGSQIVIRIVSQDGTTQQAVLYAGQTETSDPPTSEWTTGLTNRGFPRAGLLPVTLSSYACAEGDRLVVEVGARAFSTNLASTSRQLRCGDVAASDLVEDETGTSDFNPWIEFSDTIVLSTKGNYDWVNEKPPNDATDYVFDSVVNDYDLYNLPSTQWTSVAAVVLPIRAQKSDAGAASIAHMVKVDTDASGTADTENQGADVPLSNSWVYHTKYYNRQPDSTSWTPAKVNALQAGAKVR